MQRLSVRDRQILALRYALGETSAEIGKQVGLRDSGVRVRLGRLLAALRESPSGAYGPSTSAWVGDPPPGPLWSRDHYRRFLDAVLAYPPEEVVNITSWIVAHDETIRRQFDLRERFPGFPRGAGAAEDAIEEVQRAIGDRHKQIQNIYRSNLMLGLIRAHEGSHEDVTLYARVIRDELDRTNGRPKLTWREHHFTGVRRGQPGPEGFLFALADEYLDLGDREHRAYWVTAQAGSMATKLLHTNLYHFLNGYPPLALTDSEAPAVRVEGLRLRDFPLARRDWDPANPEDPDEPRASCGKKVGWICAENPDHRWRTTVFMRTGRLTDCQPCQKLRGVAAAGRFEPQVALQRLRRAWGDFETTTPIAPAPTLAALTPDGGEDF